MIDVLVVGGGPAGLAAAIEARRLGFERVVVVEQRGGVLDKACGEGLMPGALGALARLGVGQLEGLPFRGIRYVDGGRQVSAEFSVGPGLGVRRVVLHQALRERAQSLGVEWIQARAQGVELQGDHVLAAGLRARWLLAADGLASPIRAQLGLERRRRLPERFGVRRHYGVEPWSDFVEVHLARGAEAYVTPVAPGLVGVALLSQGRPRGSFERRLRERFPELAQRLGRPATPPMGAGPFERRVRRRVVGRVLLLGDAAGYLDPLTGEGLKLGLHSAQAAVAALRTGRLSQYERDWRRLSRSYWALTSLLLWARRSPWLAPRLVPLLQACPWLFQRSLDLLAGQPPVGAGFTAPDASLHKFLS